MVSRLGNKIGTVVPKRNVVAFESKHKYAKTAQRQYVASVTLLEF